METSTARGPDVVVGVDGSTLGLHAVGWAAAEARLYGLPLRIVHAAPYATDPSGAGPRRAREILARAFTVARRAEPDVVVSTARTREGAAGSLIDAAAGARLLVVGMGGGELPGEVLLGSVALDVSGRAGCPVVVVRGGPVPPHGPVLVGVESTVEDAAALTLAFADARRHGGRVIVLHACHGGPLRGRGDTSHDALHDGLAPWTTRYPEVPVEEMVVPGNPTAALLRAAEGARLVVLGTRGQGPYARALFGSTSREVLRRSPVPVMVVSPGTVVPHAEPDQVGTSPSPRPEIDRPHDHSMLY